VRGRRWRGRKGGQRSGGHSLPTALLRLLGKEGKTRMGKRVLTRGGRGQRGRESDNRRDEERGSHCWWEERKSGIERASFRLPRLGHARGEIARVSMRSGRNPKSLRNWEKEIPSINLSLSPSLLWIYLHRAKITCNRTHASNMGYEGKEKVYAIV